MPIVPFDEFLKANDPLKAPEARNVQQLENGLVRVPLSMLQQPSTPQEEPGLVGGSLTRGVKTVQSDFTAVSGLAAQALGFDEVAQGFYNKAAEYAEQRDAIQRRVGRVEDIKSALDVGVFALETLLENAPLLASIAVPGLTAAKIAGFGARSALGATKSVAEAAKVALQIGRRKEVAGTFAAFLADVGLQTGESVEIAQAAGQDPLDLRVVGSGLGKGVLDFIPILKLAKLLGIKKGIPLGAAVERNIAGELVQRGFVRRTEQGFLRRAAGNVGTLIAFEVPTETAQEIINIALDRSLSQFEGELTPEEKSQLLNAAAGAAAFGLLGVPGAIAKPQGALRPATDEDLRSGDEAATPMKLLEAPALRVTPSGVVLPPGVEEADYVPAVDTPVTETAVAQGVRQALDRDQRQDAPGTFLLTEEGLTTPHEPDPLTTAVDEFRALPEFSRTPTEQAAIDIDDARAGAIITDTFEIEVPTEVQQSLPSVVETLVQMRDDVFLEPRFRRSADGQLTKAGEKRVATIDKRIASITKKLGIPNPLQQVIAQEIKDAEQLPVFNADEESRKAARADERLSVQESALLDKLESTANERELSFEEDGIRQDLVDKREGIIKDSPVPLSANEVSNLSTEEENDVRLRAEEDALRAKNLDKVQVEIDLAQEELNAEQQRFLQIDLLVAQLEKDGVDVNSTFEVARWIANKISSGALSPGVEFQTHSNDAFMPLVNTGRTLSPAQLAAQVQALVQQRGQADAAVRTALKKLSRQQLRRDTLIRDNARFRDGQGKGLPISTVMEIVRRVTAKFVNGPEYIIADSKDTTLFPEGSQKRKDIQGAAKGAFFLSEPNRVYIFADKHSNERDVVETIFHETLAHFGLRAFFTKEELDSILNTLYRTRGEEIQTRFGVPTDRREAMIFAEEYIAEVAENGIDQSTLSKAIAWIRRILRKVVPNMKFTDNDITFMLRDVSRFIQGQVPARNTRRVVDYMSNEAFLRVVGTDTMETVLPEIESLMKVWGTKFQMGVLTPLQVAERFPIPGSQEYLEFVQLWSARKGTLVKTPGDIANRWTQMPKNEAQLLSQVLLEISEKSDGLARVLTQEEEIALMKKLGASKLVFDMYKEIQASFNEVLMLLQNGLEKAAIREGVKGNANPKIEGERLFQLWQKDKSKAGHRAFLDEIARNPELEHFKLGAKLLSIDKDMSVLRNRNYFPRMRFGQYALIVRAKADLTYKGKLYKGPRTDDKGIDRLGDVVNYETFEDVSARNQRRPSLGTQFKNQERFEVSEGFVSDEEFSFLGMPPALFDALKANLGLDPMQTETLKELYFRYSPGKAFLRHLTQRKGVDGYSTDAMRVYASYMMNAANHIARVEFSEDMNIQQTVMREAVRGSKQKLRQATSAGIVQDYFNKHFRYIMNPENDLAVARSWGFLFYLGFNVKSALVNLTQVPMVAYPFLASKYGDGAATAALLRAYKSVSQWRRGKLVFDNKTDAALKRAIAEQIVDESLATELAGIGESDVLQRLMPEDANVRLTNKVAFYGSFLFKHAEKFNREVVFIAARELALKKTPNDEDAVYKASRKAVQASMFEYKKWNRPAFMRGKKSVLFLFWQYMQHLSFMAYGGEGKGSAMRVWMMLMFAAGLQGLPFAENIFDIVDFAGTEAKEALGLKNPKVAIRDDLRKFARSITDRPDIIMHGWSRYLGLGPVHLLSALGVPVPNTDISGSLSAGRVIPGTQSLLGNERNPDAQFGRTMAEVLGPVVGMGYNVWKALESDDPDTWKVWERALPTSMQSVSKAIRRQTREEETFRGGGAVVQFDPYDNEAWAENVAQAFGFATTRVNQRFELRQSQEEFKRYWIARRSKVIENLAWAILAEDKEARELAQKKLRQFNTEAPASGLRINGKALRTSLRERFRRGHLREVGMPNEEAFREAFRKFEENNPEGAPGR